MLSTVTENLRIYLFAIFFDSIKLFSEFIKKIMLKHKRNAHQQFRIYTITPKNIININSVTVKTPGKPCNCVIFRLKVEMHLYKLSYIHGHLK